MKWFDKNDPNYKLKLIVVSEGVILVFLLIAVVIAAVLKLS